MAGAAKGRPRRALRPAGNSRACILRRLRRDYPALHQEVLDGKISPHRAAIQAGFRRAPGKQPKRQPVDPSEISADQMQELWLGAGAGGSVFANEDERRATWIRHKARVMELWGKGGRRPIAWWLYEAGELDYPGYDLERSTLYAAGLLAEGERVELLAYWRREFDRLMDPNFGDTDACEQHIRWCDLPRQLLGQWANEYLRKKVEPEAEAAATGSDLV
jgi:hypothetical protein